MEQNRKPSASTIMRACTDLTLDIRSLTDAEINEVSGGFPTSFVFGGVIAVGDLRGHVMNGVAKAALEVLLGK
jgi:hypothetical protein